ncbi:hypothetical protein Bca4012_058438 [Brassica carinata]|uniref:Secreted protein n=1 Tax=Brassica carinata TaxID=52824 RepID=A0A8X7W5Y3_BRACI|nr:hypothetical protein Bca52824_016198 [Brassica carinata]
MWALSSSRLRIYQALLLLVIVLITPSHRASSTATKRDVSSSVSTALLDHRISHPRPSQLPRAPPLSLFIHRNHQPRGKLQVIVEAELMLHAAAPVLRSSPP